MCELFVVVLSSSDHAVAPPETPKANGTPGTVHVLGLRDRWTANTWKCAWWANLRTLSIARSLSCLCVLPLQNLHVHPLRIRMWDTGVAWHSKIKIRKHGDSTKYVAKVLHVGHECDLAMLTVEDVRDSLSSSVLGQLIFACVCARARVIGRGLVGLCVRAYVC